MTYFVEVIQEKQRTYATYYVFKLDHALVISSFTWTLLFTRERETDRETEALFQRTNIRK